MATVVSRLLLYAGVWDPLSAAQIRKLNTVYMRALRAAMGKDRGPHLNVTDLAVRSCSLDQYCGPQGETQTGGSCCGG